MILEIGRLRQDPGEYEYFHFDFQPADSGEDCTLLTPVHAAGSAVFGGNVFLIAGSLTARARLPCSRCLAPIDQDLSADIEEEFDEQEFPGEDAVIDLEDMASQIWLTSIPMRLLCHSECKGLCPQCGKNLNEGDCGCGDTEGDPRLEILRSLMNQQD
jgi:uncharacterized protein